MKIIKCFKNAVNFIMKTYVNNREVGIVGTWIITVHLGFEKRDENKCH